MGMPALHRRWTAAEVRELMSDPNPTPRYELLDGDLLVTPAPRPIHQRVVQQLYLLLAPYVAANGIGEVLLSPADLELQPETILQPDLFVVPLGHIPHDTWATVKALLLAVEVLSPSSAHFDRVRKRRFFQRVGVPEYWVVDTDARLIERWRPGDERPELADGRFAWSPPDAAEPLDVDVVRLFDLAQPPRVQE
jgi:Uma2 family endonuclease